MFDVIFKTISRSASSDYKMQGVAERFISNKAQSTSIFKGFKSDPFYTYLVSLFSKKLLVQMLYKPGNLGKSKGFNKRSLFHA